MKFNIFIFFSFFSCSFLLFSPSCSKAKKETKQVQSQSEIKQQRQSPGPHFFQDDFYPLRIDYISGLKFYAGRGEREVKGTEDYYRYTNDPIGVSLDLYQQFSDEWDEEPNWELFEIEFFPSEVDFKDYRREYPFRVEDRVVFFGNVPALPMGKDSSGYILLTPGFYATLVIMGGNIRELYSEEIAQAYSDRVADITKQMLARIQWLKPIDVNSQEFKDWKAHILKILDEARGGR